jgi:lipopolysaccharide assembly outer membrane protein LptD (OstA)
VNKNLFFLSVIFLYALLNAQTPAVPSAMPRDMETDSLSAPPREPDTISYKASVINYNAQNKMLYLNGEAQLEYQSIVLMADTIRYNTETNILEAVGSPILKDDDEEIISEWMAYNVKTRWGKARFGTTEMEKSVYNGRTIRKTEEDILLVSDGDFTTCTNGDSAHYYFYGKRMKIITNDKVIARPVVMNIAEVPVATLPYFVFPLKTGRRSGILQPGYGGSEYGDAGRGSRYVDNLGYYFAPNDYYDIAAKAKITEFRNVQMRGDLNYALRYWLNGSLNGSFYLTDDDLSIRQRWDLNYWHDQKLTPDGSLMLKGKGSLMGDKEYQEKTSDSLEQIINKKMNAHLTLKKVWKNGMSLSLTGSQNRDLITDRIEETIPGLSFQLGQKLLIKPPSTTSTDTSLEGSEKENDPKWYHSIYYNYHNTALQKRVTDSGFVIQHKGAEHHASIRSPQKLFRWYTVSPFFNYDEYWFDSKLDTTIHLFSAIDTATGDTVDLQDVEGDTASGFYRRGNFKTGVSINTNLYGIFPIPIGRFVGIRHTLTPSMKYTFSPEQTNGWRYAHVGIGNASDQVEQQSIHFSLDNLFQGKLKEDKKKNKRERKFTLINTNLGTGYNFVAPKQRMEDLTLNASTNLLNKLRLNYNSTYSFYDEKDEWRTPYFVKQRINTSTGFNLNGKWWTGELDRDTTEKDERFPAETWNLNISHSYTYSFAKDLSGKQTRSKSYSLGGNAKVNFTRTWSLNYSARYDFTTNQLASQRLNFYKDLHCWKMIFNWTPTGPTSGYYFRIDIKEIPDIKIEKQDHNTTGY